VLDLDGVLVKSDWNRERGWRTFKRPGVDAFLKHMAQVRPTLRRLLFAFRAFVAHLHHAGPMCLTRLSAVL
jgi:hypothetical protein